VLPRMVLRFEQLLRPWLASEEDEASPPDALSVAQVEALNSLGTVPQDSCKARRLGAYLDGFSLHAGVHLHANDRKGLARLCGYGARPPLSQERLSQLPDGRIAYQLKRPLGDGRQLLLMRPTELLRRLATLVPPPRAHLVRYHGVFGPALGWRRQVIPLCSESSKTALPCAFPPQRTDRHRPRSDRGHVPSTLSPREKAKRQFLAALSGRSPGFRTGRERPLRPRPSGPPTFPRANERSKWRLTEVP
jgi:hypothetical protein